MDKVTGQCPHTTTFLKRRAEAVSNRGPSAYQPNALPLGQTVSLLQAGIEKQVVFVACTAQLAYRLHNYDGITGTCPHFLLHALGSQQLAP